MSKLAKVEKCIEKGKEAELIKLAQDKHKEVRLAAIAGLGKVGKDDAFNAMIALLTDADPDFRAASVTALGEMGNNHADAHLRHRLELEKDERVLEALKKAIPKLRRDSD